MPNPLQLVPLESSDPLPPLAICALESWSVTKVSGDERIHYLNGQLTADLTTLQPGDSTLCAQCDAKGKMIALMRLFVLSDCILLAQKKSTTELQQAALKKYAVFSKVEIATSNEWHLYGIAGTEAPQWIEQQFPNPQLSDTLIVKIDSPAPRYLLLSRTAPEANTAESLWQALDIRSCMPMLEEETQEEFIPQMLNLQALDGISFSKGCYLGQETVARAKYRGANKRACYRLTGEGLEMPNAGDTLEIELEEDHWKKIGTVLQAVQYGDKQNELLAVLPNDRPLDDAAIRLKDDPASSYQITTLPYSIE